MSTIAHPELVSDQSTPDANRHYVNPVGIAIALFGALALVISEFMP